MYEPIKSIPICDRQNEKIKVNNFVNKALISNIEYRKKKIEKKI
jgi:hypothetical protein